MKRRLRPPSGCSGVQISGCVRLPLRCHARLDPFNTARIAAPSVILLGFFRLAGPICYNRAKAGLPVGPDESTDHLQREPSASM